MWESDGGLLARVDKTKMPRHVAIIMDGNGRWGQDAQKYFKDGS